MSVILCPSCHANCWKRTPNAANGSPIYHCLSDGCGAMWCEQPPTSQSNPELAEGMNSFDTLMNQHVDLAIVDSLESERSSSAENEWTDSPERTKSWQAFLRDRLKIKPGEEKYVASGFSLRDMWTAFAAGRKSVVTAPTQHSNPIVDDEKKTLQEQLDYYFEERRERHEFIGSVHERTILWRIRGAAMRLVDALDLTKK